jgi:hypothetical protein
VVKNGLGSGSSGGERGAVITGVVGGRLQSSVSLSVRGDITSLFLI